MMEYQYEIVSDISSSGSWSVTNALKQGYTIDQITSTSNSVHYLLKRETPKPEDIAQQLEKADTSSKRADAVEPINLDDIPF